MDGCCHHASCSLTKFGVTNVHQSELSRRYERLTSQFKIFPHKFFLTSVAMIFCEVGRSQPKCLLIKKRQFRCLSNTCASTLRIGSSVVDQRHIVPHNATTSCIEHVAVHLMAATYTYCCPDMQQVQLDSGEHSRLMGFSLATFQLGDWYS